MACHPQAVRDPRHGLNRVRPRLGAPLRPYGAVFANESLRQLELAWAGSIFGQWAYEVALAVFTYRLVNLWLPLVPALVARGSLKRSEELQLATQELQAGAVRKEALTRCADRIGIDEFRGLITFLTQTEELGGSIARSLRVYASTMREKRSRAAEEAARKAVIKLIFPLVFFILPAIFILILGPASLSIMRTLSNPLQG